ELRLRLREVDLAAPSLEGLPSTLARLERGRLVELVGVQGAVGEHRHEMRLNLEYAARDVKEFLVAAALHAHGAGLQMRQQRRVARRDAELAHLRGREHHVGFAREDRAFGADDIDMNGHALSVTL